MKVNFEVAESLKKEIDSTFINIANTLKIAQSLVFMVKSSGWEDAKQRDLEIHLDSIISDTKNSLKILQDYSKHLGEKIKLKY